MITKVLIYGFAFFLILLEWLLRSAMKLDTQSLMGTTLASVGLGLIVPLVRPKKRDLGISSKLQTELEGQGVTVMSTREKRFIEFIWLCVFIFTGGWIFTVYLSSTNPDYVWWADIPVYLYIGFGSYFLGVILAEMYERV
jgi:hypothetical protein